MTTRNIAQSLIIQCFGEHAFTNIYIAVVMRQALYGITPIKLLQQYKASTLKSVASLHVARAQLNVGLNALNTRFYSRWSGWETTGLVDAAAE